MLFKKTLKFTGYEMPSHLGRDPGRLLTLGDSFGPSFAGCQESCCRRPLKVVTDKIGQWWWRSHVAQETTEANEIERIRRNQLTSEACVLCATMSLDVLNLS